MSVSAERLSAARLMVRVEAGAFSSRLLAGVTAPGVRARVLGALRWQRSLDAVLAPLCRRSLDRLDAEVRAVLRIGLFEVMVLGVPASVATDAAVHLTRRLGKSSAAALVNAVLRRAVTSWSEALEGVPPDVRLSHPEWLHGRWVAALGAEVARRIMEVNQEPAPPWVWFLDDAASQELERAGIELEDHPWCPGARTARDQARELVTMVEQGRAYVQDPSSQLVARIGALLAPAGARLVDLCAAPGGKLALLSRIGQWSRIVGVELLPRRMELVRSLLRRAAGEVGLVVADAGLPPLAARSWDLVLLDAPCSGTGTLRRHPELRWRLRPEALPELVAVQRRLLAAALDLVAPGGCLLYATCSIEPEENEDLLRSIAEGFSNQALDEVLPEGTPFRITSAGGVRILPSVECDGFTVHAVRRALQSRA